MKLEVFKNKVKVLRKEEGDRLREKYIEQFINRSGPFWERIEDIFVRRTRAFTRGYIYIYIYIFDDSFSWTPILTHEDIDGERYCLKSGDI